MFTTNSPSFKPTTVAITSWFVGFVVLYSIVTFGASLSIQLTTTGIVVLFPALSSNINSNLPFSLNVYEVLPSLFITLASFEMFSKVTITLPFVASLVL